MTDRADENPAADDEQELQSRTRKRKQSIEIAALGVRLIELPVERLAQLDLDAELMGAIELHRGLRGSALGRQKRLIAQLLRGLDHADIEKRLLERRSRPGPNDRLSLDWLKRLLEEGDSALNAFIEAHPDADRRQLRGLMRGAAKTDDARTSRRANDKLLRLVRQHLR